jgi:hypothetical protein
MTYGLNGQVLIPGMGKTFFFTPQRPDQLWGPPSLLFTRYLGAKRLDREADHSSPSSPEVKTIGLITPLLHTSSYRGA